MIPSPRAGQQGVIPDQPDHTLPFGAWSEAQNIRFDDGDMRRILEPALRLALPVGHTGLWFQLYEDANGPRVVVATQTGSGDALLRLALAGDSWDTVTPLAGLTSGGQWHSFQWGESPVFNNGIDDPVILLEGDTEFKTLPGWGLLTSGQKVVRCKSLRPTKTRMLACNVSIDGIEFPNMAWWSGPGVLDNNPADFFSPSWDYEDLGSTSGFDYIGVDDGPLVDSLVMDNDMMVYTAASVYALTLVGGTFVFNNDKRADYGLMGLGSVAEFNNTHFCVGPNTIFVHDGSTVTHIADQRYEDAFYKSLLDFENVTCEENVEFKEIQILYNGLNGRRQYLIYNYGDNTWYNGDADVEGDRAAAMAYDFELPEGTETWNTITTLWSNEPRRWSDIEQQGRRRAMYWLTTTGLYVAESSDVRDSQKRYYASRKKLTFAELDPSFTTDLWKFLSEVYPHVYGEALTEFTFGWSETVTGTPTEEDPLSFNPQTDSKINPHITARYFAMEVEIVGDGAWRLASMDYDLEPLYGQ